MPYTNQEQYVIDMCADNDRHNIAIIDAALESGRINADAAAHLSHLYSDSLNKFREVFYFLGKCFGAPKAPVIRYDYEHDCAVDEPIRISDINPSSPYIVQHRLDADPMRNQFFTSGAGHQIDLAVSSIVTVIVGAQKNVNRALDKVTGKYYDIYVNNVIETTERILTDMVDAKFADRVTAQIRERMATDYISDAAELALSIIGPGYEGATCELIRALDKLQKPRYQLQDVYRVKCLFDLIPQARTFIERVQEMMPNRVLSVRDKFYDIDNPRNYRDAKLIIDIGRDGRVVPLEIICQVRTFFEFERNTHDAYAVARGSDATSADKIERKVADYMDLGVREYNLMICRCLDDLFERVGWNILYSQDGDVSLFEGFPKKCKLYYPSKILDQITEKLSDAVQNEIFRVTNAPAKLTPAQENEIFHFMARFILIAAMPYLGRNWRVPGDTMAVKLFNFVMTEVQRYYKK